MSISKWRISRIWAKAHPIDGVNPNTYRKDDFDHIIRKASYGTRGKYGWHVDHKNPLSKGGSDKLQNLRPLYWRENQRKSDQYPYKKPTISKITQKVKVRTEKPLPKHIKKALGISMLNPQEPKSNYYKKMTQSITPKPPKRFRS